MDIADRSYPARLDGHLDPGLSRWKWVIKWLLVIPHLVVLLFLWIAAVVLTVIAGVAILFTGHAMDVAGLLLRRQRLRD
jgi:hypothetical protein